MKQNEEKQSRREFIKGFGIISTVIVAMGTFVYNSFSYLLPDRKEKTYHKYLVAKGNEISIGKAKEINLGGKPVFVVRLEEGYKVFSGGLYPSGLYRALGGK